MTMTSEKTPQRVSPLLPAIIMLGFMAVAPIASYAQATIAMTEEEKAKEAKEAKEEKVIKLSPFIVSSEKDVGYYAKDTAAGSRFAQDRLDVPGTIVIINRSLIEDLNAQSQLDLVSVGVAGVTPIRTDLEQFSFRGFGASYQLRDGAILKSYKKAPLYDVDRVEVIKGPSAVAFANSQFIGGALNQIPRGPTPAFSIEGKVTLSDHSYFRVEAAVAGPIKMVESNQFSAGYRITVGREKGDFDKLNWHDDNSFIGGLFDFKFGETTLRVNYFYYKDFGFKVWEDFLDNTTPTYLTAFGTATKAKLNKYSTRTIGTYADLKDDVYHDNVQAQMNVKSTTKLSENGNLSLFMSKAKTVADYTISRFGILRADNYTVTRTFSPDLRQVTSYDMAVDYLHRLQQRTWGNDLAIGIDYNWQQETSRASVVNFPDMDTRDPAARYAADKAVFATYYAQYPWVKPANHQLASQIGTPRTAQINSNYSYYFQDTVKLWDNRINLTYGLRWLTLMSRNITYYNPGAPTTDITQNVTRPSPDRNVLPYKKGIVYKILPDVSIYWDTSANVIPPPQNSLDQFGARVPDKDAFLKEYGIKANRVLNKHVSISGDVVNFHAEQTNQAYNILDKTGAIVATGYSPGDTTDGWEVDFGPRITLKNGYVDIIATYTHIASKNQAGLQMASLPPEKRSLLLKYTFTSGPLANFMIGGTYVESSDQLGGTSWLIHNGPIFNGFTSYRYRKNWSAQVNVTNFSDKRFPLGVNNTANVWTNDPFRVRVTFGYKM